MTRICLAVILLFAVGNPLQAFNPAEHREVSNEALRLCSRILGPYLGKTLPVDATRLQQAQEALDFLLVSKDRPDYGQLVLAVDHYSIAPAPDFEGQALFVDRKRSQLGLPGEALNSNWLAISARRLGAIHRNDLHFQQAAAGGVKHFHQEAATRAAAAKDGNGLKMAFILNAIADHLMQDFLAGGHVATPRANYHDLAAATIHDSYNKKGVPFSLSTETEAWSQLEQLTFNIADVAASGEDAELKAVSKELTDFVLAPGAKFHGDGRLACTPGHRTYMLLITTRSILDIVESFLLREPVDKVASSQWSFEPALAEAIVEQSEGLKIKESAKATTPSGAYDLEELNTIYTSVEGFKPRSLVVAFSTSDFPRQGALDFDLVTRSGFPPGAVMYQTPEGGKVNALRSPDWTFGSYGLSYLFAPGLRGVDSHVSVHGALEGQDVLISLRMGVGAFQYSSKTTAKLTGGIGIGWGFGLLYAEARYDRSYIARPGGNLHGRWAPSLGIKAMFPTTWISHLIPGTQACN